MRVFFEKPLFYSLIEVKKTCTVTDLPETSDIGFCYCCYYLVIKNSFEFAVSSIPNSYFEIAPWTVSMQHIFTRSLVNISISSKRLPKVFLSFV